MLQNERADCFEPTETYASDHYFEFHFASHSCHSGDPQYSNIHCLQFRNPPFSHHRSDYPGHWHSLFQMPLVIILHLERRIKLITQIDMTLRANAARMLALQIPAYQKEAELIHFHDLPPLKDTIETIQTCGETFYGFYQNEKLCGAVSYKIGQGVLDIHRLMVHPQHFRKGIAGKLLHFIISHEKNITKVIVATGSENIPALKFYQKYSFQKSCEFKTAEGLSITAFEKKL